MSPFIRILLERFFSIARHFDYANRTIHRCFPLTRPLFKLLSVILCASLSAGIIQAQVTLTVSKGGAGHEADIELLWSPPNNQDVLVYSMGGSFDLLSGTVPPVQYHEGILKDGINYAYEVVDPGSVTLPGTLFSTDAIIGNLRYVPASTPWGFIQGSPADEICRNIVETQFTHTLTRNIAVMETETTRAMWADLKKAQPTLPDDPTYPVFGPTHPASNVTWYEAVLFANLMSVQNGYCPCYYRDADFTIQVDATNYLSDEIYCDFNVDGYRLLSEGEWEFAVRAGSTGPFFCVEKEYTSENCTYCDTGLFPTLELYANFCTNSWTGPQPVGSRHKNPWGLYDMAGNVREWCWDWEGAYPDIGTDYTGPGSGTERICRGSMFRYRARMMRSAWRDAFAPDTIGQYIGFRLARTVD